MEITKADTETLELNNTDSKDIKVLFHRDYRCFQGGHLKVWHYFNHVNSIPGYCAKVFFSPNSIMDKTNPWINEKSLVVNEYDPANADIIFIAGQDWEALEKNFCNAPKKPIINFLQGTRHADPKSPLYNFLQYPRLCS